MPKRRRSGFLDRLQTNAFAPVDIASLAFFRISFGLLVAWKVQNFWAHDQINQVWINPRFLFKYCGFFWVHPWPGNWLYVHWILLGVLALFIAAGSLYRISALLFFLSQTYFFLLDQGAYVNHYYLICLFGFLLIFVPANRAFSIDAWLFPRIRTETVPAWNLWLMRTQMGVVYFFAGVAKVSPDWLRGEPMRGMLARSDVFPFLHDFFQGSMAGYFASYIAVSFDLFIVPLLLWRRTRLVAFFLAVCFHILNACLFPIDIFPWLGIAATTLFLSPSWPRRIFRFLPQLAANSSPKPLPASKRKRTAILLFAGTYAAIQVLVPLRHFLFPGGIEWAYMEHRFSWQMLLRNRRTITFFYITDPNNGETYQVRPERYLHTQQILHMGWRPDMVWQFAQFLGRVMPRTGPEPLKVEVRMLVSVNGRKPQLFLDPNVDLAAEPYPFVRPRWLLQVHEPLPPIGTDQSQDEFD